MNNGYDVVVAGCGVAGLSAAVTAAELGKRVAVIERATREERGGQSRISSQEMPAPRRLSVPKARPDAHSK